MPGYNNAARQVFEIENQLVTDIAGGGMFPCTDVGQRE